MKGGRVPGLSMLSGTFLHFPCSVLSVISGHHHKAPSVMHIQTARETRSTMNKIESLCRETSKDHLMQRSKHTEIIGNKKGKKAIGNKKGKKQYADTTKF
ncbi:unnamed protein product [Fraxinus pennsylvanica]|uniref:Uncharacterized protein n=1 Tax=Fraxinus pennsylvanica TaxID=56036 RepID=A0AAD2ED08_9LAMI|nr:unnamed protein product [Fraxinus pennsylvanica]